MLHGALFLHFHQKPPLLPLLQLKLRLGRAAERTVLLADQALVTAHDLARFMPTGMDQTAGALSPAPTGHPSPLVPLVRDYGSAQSHGVAALQRALAEHQGNQSRAAQSLGLTLRQFGYRLRKAGLR